MDLKKIIEREEYNFLRNNPLLKDRIIFLTISGSHAYGTNINSSDIDIRGVFLERETDTLGLTNLEQYEDDKTGMQTFSWT